MDDAQKHANAAFYAIRAIVDGLRDAGQLPEAAIEMRLRMELNLASVWEGQCADDARKHAGDQSVQELAVSAHGNAQSVRHGMWWLWNCLAGTYGADPEWNPNHSPHLSDELQSIAELREEDDQEA